MRESLSTGCLTNTTQFLDTLSYLVSFIMSSPPTLCSSAILADEMSLSFQMPSHPVHVGSTSGPLIITAAESA